MSRRGLTVVSDIHRIAMAVLLFLTLACPPSASSQTAPETMAPVVVDAELLIELARLTEDKLAEVLAGGIASIQVPADKPLDANAFDIYTAFALLIDAPTEAVGQVLMRREWASAGISGAQVWRLDTNPEFAQIVFRKDDSREIKRILKGRDEVNLSAAELRYLQGLDLDSPFDEADRERFSTAYRDILRARYERYRQDGLEGIAAYEEGRNSWSPAEHFRLVNRYWDAWLPVVLSQYSGELSQTSADMGPNIIQAFLLARKPVEDRPIYSVIHRFGRVEDDVVAAVHREFFVSGSYSAMQIVLVGVPYRAGTLVILGADTFTEKVTGFASGIKHKAGRKIASELMIGMLRDVRAQAMELAQTN